MVVHLAPLPVVAKVRTAAGSAGPVGQQTELRIGLHLAWAGAPVAGPSTELPARVHRYQQHALTFWRYQQHDATAVIDGAGAGRMLGECHRALNTYPWPLPSFLSRQASRAGRRPGQPCATECASGTRTRLAA
jgi:hypothetical protein